MDIPLPNLPRLFSSVEWTLTVPQQKNRSAFTGRTQVIGLPGSEYWRATATVLPLATEGAARRWRAFFAALRGAENTFRLPALPSPQSSGGYGNPIVQATSANLAEVTVDQPAPIFPGMHMTVAQPGGVFRLVVVTFKLGNVIGFQPPLTAPALVGAGVYLSEPFCVMRLTSGDVKWTDADTVGFQIEAEEAL